MRVFTLSQESWIALPGLSITHRYEFLNVRERAIREIYGLSNMRGRVVVDDDVEGGAGNTVQRELEAA